ncbi:hypothetical protein [Methanotorris formicicus]|uniref:Uncharacterized protein n=1 Tax=Methanotorris formicicus Mc-S-70 TaxID=647171 RepID=H1KYC4_9EURY|nr:hypothetical protein [Methanotorris formicicus]EHP87389.1 hypothetical protein MetfoDRAFT_0797 [Methanotorris formicicus Mc-S-70]
MNIRKNLLFLILALVFITQSYAYLTVEFNITNRDTNETKTFDYYVDLNQLNNPKTYENDYSTIKLWLENYTDSGNTYYYLHWNITAKVNLNYTAELFDTSNEHPDWTGSNPYGPKNLNVAYYDHEYWTSIKHDEIGPEYKPSTTKSPIPLGAIILTLIVVPLLTLRKVKK